jgi:outer membrane lipoprotein-sorting protein
MKRKIKTITIFILIIGSFSNLYSMTGSDALAKFRSVMYGIPKMTGIITWTTPSGHSSVASFKYMSPGKIYVKFSNPSGKTIVSNGKTLWVYNSSSKICGIQDLSRGLSGGIAGFTNGYNAIVVSQGNGYTLKLKNSSKKYSEIILILTPSFFLKKAILKSGNGSFTFSLSNINTKVGVVNSLFNFNVPSNAQTVKNPLNIR